MSALPQILHIDLRSLTADYADLRYSKGNLNAFESRPLPLADIQDLIEQMERDYYVALPEEYVKTGRRLYEWLDGSDRWLSTLLGSGAAVLAIATEQRLAHLPWEVLHDERGFLVGRSQPVVPVRWQGERLTWQTAAVPNRPLQMLFMATSPVGVEPVLAFEAEEGRILEATQRQPLTLTVEESGCLDELADLLTSYDREHFDVVHLSGHAWISEDGPRFITETETGDRFDASPQDIAKALQFRFPALMFLSGCRTGQSGGQGEVPSMAAALLDAGAGAVLGWGRPVRDVDGILAAAALSAALAGASTLPEALAKTYQAMIAQKAQDWHLLRLYVAGAMPQNLVTPLKTKGRQKALKPSMAMDFLDVEQRVKVPKRESFVGRRRPLQACLRALKDPERTGVLIHGMGGLGKSSLAARLCDRLPHFERVVMFGPLDEAELVNKLADKIRNPELRQRVRDPNEELKFRLRDVFEAQVDRAFLLVLDDFEANLEPVEQGFRLTAGAARVLRALMWAIKEAQSVSEIGHRVVMTCRYNFKFDGLGRMYKEPLAPLRQADLAKKCRQLAAFGEKSTIENTLRERALRLADGNPRLLEWLDKVLRHPAELGQGSVAAVLDELEEKPAKLREKVLAEVLVQQMDAPMREMLGRAMVYELPVPRAAISIVCESLPQADNLIDRAISLGLLEQDSSRALRVPRVLPIMAVDSECIAKQAAQTLADIWANINGIEGIKVLEIHRLAMFGKDKELAISTALSISQSWLTKTGDFWKTIDLCKSTFALAKHPKLLVSIAIAKNTIGLAEEAYELYQEALRLLENSTLSDDAKTQIRVEISSRLADLKFQNGELEQALAEYLKCLKNSRKIESNDVRAHIYQKIGAVYIDLSQTDRAIYAYNKALSLVKDDNTSLLKGGVIHDIARAYFSIGKIDKSIAAFVSALKYFEDTGNFLGFNGALFELGRILAAKEEYDSALSVFERCRSYFKTSGDVATYAKSLHEIGNIYLQQGRASKALSLFKETLRIEEGVGSPSDLLITLNNLASAYLVMKSFKKCRKYVDRSLELIETIQGNPSTKANTYSLLATISLMEGRRKEATYAFQSALNYYDKAGEKVGYATTALSVGCILFDSFEDPEGALKYLRQSFEIFNELGHPMKTEVGKKIILVEVKQALDNT